MHPDWASLGGWRRGVPLASSSSVRDPHGLIESSSNAVSSSISSPHSSYSLPTEIMEHMEDYVHGLSQIEFYHGSNRDLLSWSHASKGDREHVATLEGLALLLVFTPKGDVAATSYWRSSNELKLLWAKNQPIDDSNQLKYIEDMFEKVKNGAEVPELLDMVIPMCRGKIFYRVQKLARSFGMQNNQRQEESNLWRFNETDESHQNLGVELKKLGWFQDKSTVQGLDNFTRLLATITRTSEIKDFCIILYFSYSVTSMANLNMVLEEKQVRYLSKLGNYVRIINRVSLILKKAGKAKISIEQVRPPTAKPIEVLSGSLDVLNLRCGQILSDEITQIKTWKLVTDKYQGAQPGHPTVGKKTVRFTQHCEITLALEMLARYTQRGITRRRIETGVSKACCEWCFQYLHLLASADPNHPILVRASHGKQPDGWLMPPNGSKSVAREMAKSIVGKVDDIIWKIEGSDDLPDCVEEDTDRRARDVKNIREIKPDFM